MRTELPMAIVNTFRRWPLAIPVIAAVVGCAACPQDCGTGKACRRGGVCGALCGIYHGTLADEVMCCSTGCLSQAGGVCGCPPGPRCGSECTQCRECCVIPLGLAGPLLEKTQAGPPPATCRPPLPPKFLPVPTQPTVSPARADAPEPQRGEIEVGYRNQLTSPGRD